MVLNELIPMLAAQGLEPTSRVGFLGWSMGGYGALLLGARLGAARTAAICAVSPALWTSSGASAPGAFDGADDYAANSVWGLPALNSIPIRIDCGNSDPFYSATQQFIGQLGNPPSGGFSTSGARRWVLELAAARRGGLDGTVAGRLDRDPALGRGQPDVTAKVAARQANRLHQRISCIARRGQGRHLFPTTDSTRPPDDTMAPSSRRAVPACSTARGPREPTMTSPTRGRPG